MLCGDSKQQREAHFASFHASSLRGVLPRRHFNWYWYALVFFKVQVSLPTPMEIANKTSQDCLLCGIDCICMYISRQTSLARSSEDILNENHWGPTQQHWIQAVVNKHYLGTLQGCFGSRLQLTGYQFREKKRCYVNRSNWQNPELEKYNSRFYQIQNRLVMYFSISSGLVGKEVHLSSSPMLQSIARTSYYITRKKESRKLKSCLK